MSETADSKLINYWWDLQNTVYLFFWVSFFVLLFFWAGRICFVPNFEGLNKKFTD